MYPGACPLAFTHRLRSSAMPLKSSCHAAAPVGLPPPLRLPFPVAAALALASDDIGAGPLLCPSAERGVSTAINPVKTAIPLRTRVTFMLAPSGTTISPLVGGNPITARSRLAPMGPRKDFGGGADR